MVYESKMMTKVIDLVREIYVEFDSDSIGRATRMVLEEDVNHRLKPHEVAKQVIAILNEEPVSQRERLQEELLHRRTSVITLQMITNKETLCFFVFLCSPRHKNLLLWHREYTILFNKNLLV